MVRQLLNEGAHVVASCRRPESAGHLQELAAATGPRLEIVRLDVSDEESIADAASLLRNDNKVFSLLVNVAGVLHHGTTVQPEKRIESVTPEALRRVFEVNAFGPLLVLKHFHPLVDNKERAVIANVSARVGSIDDNRLGGWYAYRASKAAQNMFTKNLSIELTRRSKERIVIALHPGTVATQLSDPSYPSFSQSDASRPNAGPLNC